MDDLPHPAPRPDWRDPASYDYLLTLDRAGWAWEFLRRNPRYRDQAAEAIPVPRSCPLPKRALELLIPNISIGAQDWGLYFP
jgi:hypothetical protein